MSGMKSIAPIRVLPDEVANKIAAGEVVERPASAVKELVENALDAGATRISVRLVAAGRRLIEVQDNGHGMSEQNALLAIERHATSKIRNAQDLDNIQTLGFRGEALASIAAVSRFTMTTRRAGEESATLLRVEGGILREVQQTGAPEGTRISVNRLYFNTPVRAKFLKGITTELNHCIDIVQRLALANGGVGFQLVHNDRMLLDVPEHATLRDRVALIWGLSFIQDMVEVNGEQQGFTLAGLAGTPELTRASRSHQFFFVNGRPVVNPALQYGLQDAYRGLITVGRHPVAVLLLTLNPRQVDVNIHPTKREIRFRDERTAHDAVRDIVRDALGRFSKAAATEAALDTESIAKQHFPRETAVVTPEPLDAPPVLPVTETEPVAKTPPARPPTAVQADGAFPDSVPEPGWETREIPGLEKAKGRREMPEEAPEESLVPRGCFEALETVGDAPLQVFDTYLLVPEGKRLLIIDQHALHERLNYDALLSELEGNEYAVQQLAVPVVFEVAPSQVALLESHLALFRELGIELETFGGNSFQVSGVCHLYAESKAPDVVLALLDQLAQGNLFGQDHTRADLLRTATRACKASIKAGDRLTLEERRRLLEGFYRLQPPYTCPHGRPIIVELTRQQMEKSFRRIQ
ncbi:MAG TPA: DNA mismatch repair endonuclease MutL [Candidatus Hydrogenedentes bacterium]|jgi:DNA mismatch repair protein MutL|nr:MAG: DNA mismatch repair protein MutL [Candidatus Hydrogenedentes bacterium ADurb.Bin179]HOC67926.1 DNA mismatch repair endonuclease MutL [Candidatus Hydrogenedentota bacterium]